MENYSDLKHDSPIKTLKMKQEMITTIGYT